MKYLVQIVRFIVGFLFIISGLIKLNDPMGFSFKLEDYFAPDVLNLPFLEPFTLHLSVFVCLVEILLGVTLLIGFLRKFTLWSLLLMLIFFGFLTFYSAYFNKVTDCGCFGDAIKFTPWQSFLKDIFLLILTLFLWKYQTYITPIFDKKKSVIVVLVSLFCCVFFVNYVYNHLPVKDFRPYKIGVNIPKAMEIPEGAPMPKYDYIWKFNENGKEVTYTTSRDYPSSDGEFLSVETKEIDKGYIPPIHDFYIEKDDESYFEEIMNAEKVLLITSHKIEKSDKEAFKKIKVLTDEALKKGYKVIGLTSILAQGEAIKKEYELNFDFYFNDATTLKTIIRSNPGVVILKKGTIVNKKHHNDIDEIKL